MHSFKRNFLAVVTLLPAAFLFSRCGQQQSVPATGGGDSAFSQFSEAFLKSWLDWRPQSAVSLGFHEYDKQITDYSKASIDAELSRLAVERQFPALFANAKANLADSLRICRLCVSIKTQCQGMSVDEATKFFMDNWYQGDKPSRQEAKANGVINYKEKFERS